MRIKFPLSALLLTLLCGGTTTAVAEPGAAASTPSITARAGVHPDFDRVVFDWPQNVTYNVHQEGARAIIQFSATADVHFQTGMFAYLTRARDFSATTDKDGHLTVSFTVNPKATLKDFTSEKSVVIDVQGAAAPVVEGEKTVGAVPSSSPAPVVPAVAPSVPKAEPTPTVIAAPVLASTPPVTSTPPKEMASEAPVVLSSPAPSLAPPPVAVPSLATVKPAVPVVAVAPSGAPVSSKLAPSPAFGATSTLSPSDITETPLLVASLDPHVIIRSAIYQRGGYGYIVFDRKLSLDLSALVAGQDAPRVTLEPLDLMKASGFRFPLPPDVEIRATRSGTIWKIFLSKQIPDVPVSTSLVAQPDFALGARFLLPLSDAPEPVRLTDPVVGDDLIIVPLEQTEAFSVGRRMADFLILPAAQGLIIKPLADKVLARAVSDGVEITAEGGLHLSRAEDTGASQQSTQKARAAAAGKSMFDFAAWRGKPTETFTETRQRLQQTIVDVPDAERNRARLELARFYFAHGCGEEALAMLQYLAKQIPDLAVHADFIALRGAAETLAYRAQDGLKDLNSSVLGDQPEIELWQAVAAAELRNWTDAEEKFSVAEHMLGGYPEPFYSRFSALAVEAALATGKDHEAADWLDRLENEPHSSAVDPAVEYLHGVLHAKAGRAVAAESAWKHVDTLSDRLYKIRAEMALIDLGVSTGSLTAAQAADRLEALRFGWRGDDLELDILHRLGQFYVQAKNVKSGLNILSQAIQLYPDSPIASQIHSEMQGIFHDIFLSDLGKALSPLDALTLYQQYRNLMPAGTEAEAVMRNLAERLVAIDLLEQASNLLEDLVKNHLQGKDKGRASARLAAIRLLDHKPEQALAALQLSDGEFFPSDLQNERLLLRAKALSELHQDDEALALLANNTNQSARLLRADITMHAQHWGEAAKNLMELIGAPPQAGETLSHDQAEWLVNTAIALSLAGDQTGLDKLAIDYGAAMAGSPENDTFRILTRSDKTAQLHDIAAAQARMADVDMFQGFLNGYRKTTDAVKAPEEKKPPVQ